VKPYFIGITSVCSCVHVNDVMSNFDACVSKYALALGGSVLKV